MLVTSKTAGSDTLNWLQEFRKIKISSTTFYKIVLYYNDTNYIIDKRSQIGMIKTIFHSNKDEINEVCLKVQSFLDIVFLQIVTFLNIVTFLVLTNFLCTKLA